jgi:hypothetical protein
VAFVVARSALRVAGYVLRGEKSDRSEIKYASSHCLLVGDMWERLPAAIENQLSLTLK